MVGRFLEQQQAVSAVFAEDRKLWNLMPSERSLTTLEDLDAVLMPLAKFTDTFSGEKHVTVSSLQPVLTYLDGLLSPQDTERPMINELKYTIKTDLKERYNQYKPILNKSTFLDPRFRALTLSQEEKDSTIEEVKLEVVEASHDEQILQNPANSSAMADDINGPTAKKPRDPATLTDILRAISQQSATHKHGGSTMKERADEEINSYLSIPQLDVESDPLIWWKANSQSFPLLSSIARKYLSIPATSVPSERLFSSAGQIVNCRRSRMKPETVNRMVFLAVNLE